MTGPTHRDLCILAGRWLRRRGCSVVLVDVRTNRTSEQPDAIGWQYGFHSLLVEAKTSRADFFHDAKKWHRVEGGHMGQQRWFLAPRGLVTAAEVPEGWGLLEVRGSKVFVAKDAPERDFDPRLLRNEMPLMVAQIERVQQGRPTHVLPLTGEPADVDGVQEATP
jgi:hypothetical protein